MLMFFGGWGYTGSGYYYAPQSSWYMAAPAAAWYYPNTGSNFNTGYNSGFNGYSYSYSYNNYASPWSWGGWW